MNEVDLRSFTINFGPQHPAAHGVLRLVLEMDGEVVERADPHIGLLHRGTEKLIEYRPYLQNDPATSTASTTARCCCQEHAYVLAVEKLLQVEVPERALYIRVLIDEITRILNHLLNITTMALDVGAMTPLLWGFEEREHAAGVLRAASGCPDARQLLSPRRRQPRPAGGLTDDIVAWCEHLPGALDDLETPAIGEPHLQAADRRHRRGRVPRMRSTWASRARCCAPRACPGICARRSPTRSTSSIDFDIPVGKNGDCCDRYLVRMLEMRESLSIIAPVPGRRCRGARCGRDDKKVTPPPRAEMKRSMEALIHHFKLYTEGVHVPAGEVYAAVESGKGEFGVYLVSDGTNRPYRCKIRSPGYVHLQALDAHGTRPSARRRGRRSSARSTSSSGRSIDELRRPTSRPSRSRPSTRPRSRRSWRRYPAAARRAR